MVKVKEWPIKINKNALESISSGEKKVEGGAENPINAIGKSKLEMR